jgi:hypothetical protein
MLLKAWPVVVGQESITQLEEQFTHNPKLKSLNPKVAGTRRNSGKRNKKLLIVRTTAMAHLV